MLPKSMNKRPLMDGGDCFSRSQKQKTEEAAKKHALAEQVRRRRINDHIDTLRQLIAPSMTSRTVKASVLTETIRQMKELKKRAAEAALKFNGQGWSAAATSGSFTFPDESDEATVSYCEGGEGRMVKATVCCEDRLCLNRELTEAIRSVGASAVRAEMATVGGRTKAEVVVRLRQGGGEEDVGSLTRALKALVECRASGFSSLGRAMAFGRGIGVGLMIPTTNRAQLYSSLFNRGGNWKGFC
ncbi:putative transcription factor bHLH107 [Actinidia eriantha]|uniref:putative transcription factor bHLH107 n=1 Tax=Actinidia eriantha TaxID=165200 RepID=UPI00258EAEB4|nr:putative transcription factor bHLH107 [Actinidia eriantha]